MPYPDRFYPVVDSLDWIERLTRLGGQAARFGAVSASRIVTRFGADGALYGCLTDVGRAYRLDGVLTLLHPHHGHHGGLPEALGSSLEQLGIHEIQGTRPFLGRSRGFCHGWLLW